MPQQNDANSGSHRRKNTQIEPNRNPGPSASQANRKENAGSVLEQETANLDLGSRRDKNVRVRFRCRQNSDPGPRRRESRKLKFDRLETQRDLDATAVAGGANGIFTRRLDFSSFNSLPKNKLNSYQIKTEDEGNHGNDDTRCFILSTLASQGRSKVHCILCEEQLPVFDRYPLVDGTFFLSPSQHAKSCIEVKVEGRTQFLTVVCMACLEGVNGRIIYCRFCRKRWDGSSLMLGSMYSYDIFAAMPCCIERIKCNDCQKPVIHPVQRLNYFSDYSHMMACPHCNSMDTHFVKSLGFCYTRQVPRAAMLWP